MLFLYLAVLFIAGYWVVKTLWPEMAKPSVSKSASDSSSFDYSPFVESDQRVQVLEKLLVEKNKNISVLQKEIKIRQVQEDSFEKLKVLLEQEILRLREQNRIFRSELGMTTIQTKENSTT